MRAMIVCRTLMLSSAVSGCASAAFRPVSFAGETSAAAARPASGLTAHVVRNVSMKDTVLETRIRYKLEEFLLRRGYTLASADTADIYILATFGAGERMVASLAPVFREAEVRVERNREGQPVRRTFVPNRMEYLRVPLVKNSVWLQVLSSDARHYRSTGQIRNIWRGEAAMVGNADLLDDFTPYLLAATLRYFGRSTPDIVTVDVRAKEAAWR